MRKDVGPGGREPVTVPSLYGLLTGLCAMRLLMGFGPWADSDAKKLSSTPDVWISANTAAR